ncbi:MAG TPA: diguanylate cyclase [Terriglobales bacterium]|nr:diguanylate cyclase [Terriglobales bacterium]
MKRAKAKAVKRAAKRPKPAPPVDLRAIVESLNDVIYARDLAGHCTYISPAVERAFGYKPSDIVGKPILQFIHPDDRKHVANIIQSADRGEFIESEHRLLDKSGHPRWINLKAQPTMKNGRIVGAHGVFFDVTDRKRMEADLLDNQRLLQTALASEIEAATTDALTHLANRRACCATGETELRRARRYQRPLALAYLDLDNFKAVNDSLGHEVGDAVLVTVAALIKGNVRTSDLVARLGGDEFAVLLPETDAAGAQVVLGKVRTALRETFTKISGRLAPNFATRPVGCSIGVAALTEEHRNFDDLLRAADHQMYQSKREARAASA